MQPITNFATRSEKTSWARKRTNLTSYIENNIHPIEQQILDLKMSLIPFYDEVKTMRTEMVDTCIHPADEVSSNDDGSFYCSFCCKTLAEPIKEE